MSSEPTPSSLPSLTCVTIYRAEGPRGLLRIATHSDTSMLAERLYQLWRNDGLPELAGALAVERDHFLSTGKTFCHQVAFEFAYGSFVIIGEPEHPALRDWKWCVGATVGRDTHSWIEHLGEAFDSAMVQVDGKPEQVLWVRQGVRTPGLLSGRCGRSSDVQGVRGLDGRAAPEAVQPLPGGSPHRRRHAARRN